MSRVGGFRRGAVGGGNGESGGPLGRDSQVRRSELQEINMTCGGNLGYSPLERGSASTIHILGESRDLDHVEVVTRHQLYSHIRPSSVRILGPQGFGLVSDFDDGGSIRRRGDDISGNEAGDGGQQRENGEERFGEHVGIGK